MRRSQPARAGLKHLPFFEVLAHEAEGSPAALSATAGLLTLRMIDHWVLAGPVIVEPESISVRSARNAIMAMEAKDPARDVLLSIVNTMQAVREVDLGPVLPRVFAFAQAVERQHGAMSLAADGYETVVRLGSEEHELDLILDSYLRLGFCQRQLADLDRAEETYRQSISVAKQARRHAALMRSRLGIASVAMLRGNLPLADDLCEGIVSESRHLDLTAELAAAMHVQSVVAQRRNQLPRAMKLAHGALAVSHSPIERERVLSDLAAYLILLGQYDAALDALRVVEVTGVSENIRTNAMANVLIAAARAGYRAVFDQARAELAGRQLSVETRVNVLIESARGLRAFGAASEVAPLLEEAERVAREHSLNRSLVEVDEVRSGSVATGVATQTAPFTEANEAAAIARDLREMVLSLSG